MAMTEEGMKAELQAAQDLVDSVVEQRNSLSNALAQNNAVRKAEQRLIQTLKEQLQTAENMVAELEERLSKAMQPELPIANGADDTEHARIQ